MRHGKYTDYLRELMRHHSTVQLLRLQIILVKPLLDFSFTK